MTELCPAQQRAFDEILEALPIGNFFVVWAREGMGKTTIAHALSEVTEGFRLDLKPFIDDLRKADPLQLEEILEKLLLDAIKKNDVVVFDDLNLIYEVICGCGFGDSYPRSKYVEVIFTSLVSAVLRLDKKLIITTEGKIPAAIRSRCIYGTVRKLREEDYATICRLHLKKKAKELDFRKIYRFAPKLNLHQLTMSCKYLSRHKSLDTEKFIEYLHSQRMGSNVDLEEVEAIDIYSLRGIDDVIRSLEANIIVPLERDDIATEYGISPKRGVLLAGPPGTGKTTVGRALAHRLRSKFFLVDGTFISGSKDFYQKIERVFEAAKNNAPAIIFIDDSDVIFENKEDFGLYRYLLTMLDGLESESNKRVCIMMTTMDVASVPPALVRSGRIELWLETRLPNEEARLQILNDQAHRLPPELRSFDVPKLAAMTDGLTGADLKRLIEDAKILLAYDRSKETVQEDKFIYFESSADMIRANKVKYAEAEAKARSHAPSMQASIRAAFGMDSYSRYASDDDDED